MKPILLDIECLIATRIEIQRTQFGIAVSQFWYDEKQQWEEKRADTQTNIEEKKRKTKPSDNPQFNRGIERAMNASINTTKKNHIQNWQNHMPAQEMLANSNNGKHTHTHGK